MTDWFTVVEVIGLLAGLAAAIKIFWSLITWSKKKWAEVFSNTIMLEKIDYLAECVNTLTGELLTNEGTSLKDSMLRLEHNVALTSERQRARMLDSEELLYETDINGNCVWVNRTYTRAVQRSPDELMGRGWVNVIAEHNRDEVEEKWYESVDQNREFEMRIIYITPTGEEFPVMVRSYKMRHNGKTIGFLGSVTLL